MGSPWQSSWPCGSGAPPIRTSSPPGGFRAAGRGTAGALPRRGRGDGPPSASAEIVVAVTHGGLITDFLASTFSEDLLDRCHPAFLVHQSQLVAECSLTRVACAEAGYTLKTFATTSHLRGDTRYP
ncbi:MAG: hypothetical protein ACLQUY_10190 [Ktedonobacterales bacterium]